MPHVRRASVASGSTRIDLYQLHAVDPEVPLEESVGALAELRTEGKIRHIGICNITEEDLERALSVVPLVSVQNRFSLVDQSSSALVRHCDELGIAFIAWAPLAKGALSRQAALARIAARHDATPAQVALAWLLHLSPAVVPIPGTSSVAHLEENLGGSELALTPDDVHGARPAALPGVPLPSRGSPPPRRTGPPPALDRPRRAVSGGEGGAEVTVARTEKDVERLRSTWEAFQRDVVMTDPAHYRTVLEHNPRAYAPYVVLIERNGEPRAMTVGLLQRYELACRVGYKTVYKPRVRALTVVYRGFLGPEAEAEAEILVDALLGALSAGDADLLYVPNLAVGSAYHAALVKAASKPRFSRTKEHWQLVLPGSLEEFVQTKSTRSRGRIRRYPKRFLEEFDGRHRLEVYDDPRDFERVVADVESVARRTYQRGLGVTFADDPLLRNLSSVGTEARLVSRVRAVRRRRALRLLDRVRIPGCLPDGPDGLRPSLRRLPRRHVRPHAPARRPRTRRRVPHSRLRLRRCRVQAHVRDGQLAGAGRLRLRTFCTRHLGRHREDEHRRSRQRFESRRGVVGEADEETVAPAPRGRGPRENVKGLRWILAIAVALAVLLVVSIGMSAALDAPSQTSTTSTVIGAPREVVWDIVTDFPSYPEWNPYMTVSGDPRVGENLAIRLSTPGHGTQDVDATVFVLRPPRKLRWQSRTLLPGVRDLEYEIIVAPLGPSRTELVQRARFEGLLAPFVDHGATTTGLEGMAAAIAQRAETGDYK